MWSSASLACSTTRCFGKSQYIKRQSLLTSYPVLRNLHPMGSGCRRHIPASLKEHMVIMHWVQRVPKSKIARLMGIHPSTVWRVVRKMRVTGSVVKRPLQVGPHRALNSINCAVGAISRACSYSTELII